MTHPSVFFFQGKPAKIEARDPLHNYLSAGFGVLRPVADSKFVDIHGVSLLIFHRSLLARHPNQLEINCAKGLMTEPRIPRVALVGRTNVGKSTLFNRLLERQKALVSPIAGTTRDRNEGDCLWRGTVIRLIDTGGLDVEATSEIEVQTARQTQIAMNQADLILFVLDTKTGPLPQEQAFARLLKKTHLPVIVVANKAETPTERSSVETQEWQLQGLPTPIPISALRGSGVGDLLDVIYEKLTAQKTPPVPAPSETAIRVAVIGKPNVGKSTLLNALVGEERFITSTMAHTTREPNDTLIVVNDSAFLLVDTAGMRKSGKVKKTGGLEAQAVRRNQQVVRGADVTLLVVEASEPIGSQEKTLAGFIKDTGSGVILIVNKWDLIQEKTTTTINRYREYIAASIPFLQIAPVLFVSALSKQRVKTIFSMIETVQKNRTRWIDQKELDAFLNLSMKAHTPSAGKGPTPPKILGMKQTEIAPPTFDLIVKAKRESTLSESYIRFLSNRLTQTFQLEGTPIRLHIRTARSVSA